MTEIKLQSTMDVEYIDHMGTDEAVARAARVSTGLDLAEQGRIVGLINYLVREGHTSTLEHCVLKIRAHVPIFVHRQLMTHRTLSKNSESGRYKELEPVFYIPSEDRPLVNAGSGAHPELVHSALVEDGFQSIPEFTRELHEVVADTTWEAYKGLVNEGVATEVARNVLPVSIYTSLYMTGNLLAWINFLTLRNGNHGHPQYEIVEVAQKIEVIFAELYPEVYAAWSKYNRIQAILKENYYDEALEQWKTEQESK